MPDSQAQCGLCLSCGAPFEPMKGNLKLLTRKPNLSVLYIEDQCSTNETLLNAYEKPRFSAHRQLSHMFHNTDHMPAIYYMSKCHSDDNGPSFPGAGVAIPLMDGAFAYFQTRDKRNNGYLAEWDQPDDGARVDMSPLFDQVMQSKTTEANFTEDLGVTYSICTACNALMTQLSYMRYIVGFSGTAERNEHGCVIDDGFQGIRCVEAASTDGVKTVTGAYGKWTRGAGAVVNYPRRIGTSDPTAPHIAYYLHLCLPFQLNPDDDVFDDGGNPEYAKTRRVVYTQLSWLILVIACISTQIEKGKLYNRGKLSHGQHQHWGVLDLYVSFFFWRLMSFEYGPDLLGTGIDFVQWHQKYFAEAVHLKGISARDHPIVGFAAYSNVDVNSRALLKDICTRLIGLYNNQLRPLVEYVTGHFPDPIRDIPRLFVKQYFVSPAVLMGLKRLANTFVREDDFDSGVSAFGIRAMTGRVMQLCHPEIKTLLVSFRRAWEEIQIDRVRVKNDGLTMRSASVLVILCRLLDPPRDPPADKAEFDAILRGPRCSEWTSVMALRELGAFTNPLRPS